jgi:hypothetical protein
MKRSAFAILCVLAVFCLAGKAIAQADLPKAGAAHTTYLTNGIWTWYGDPKAIYFKGTYEKTYVSYFDISSNPGKVVISSYNHASKAIQSFVIDPSFGYDDHNHPSILVREPDHRILIFWCGHSGGTMRMRVSTNPEDITAWGPTQTIISGANGNNFTYPNPYQLSSESNRIYLFYRGIDWQQTMTWSDDGGTTWIKPFKFFAGGNRPYHKYHSNGIDEIHTLTEYDNRALPMQYLCIKKGGFYGAAGNLIRTIADVQANGPINSADIPNIFIRGSTTNCAGWDIALDAHGNPVFVMDSIQNGHHYYWVRWDGTKWIKHYLMNSGAEMGGEFGFACGITLDHANPNIVYLSHWVGAQPELERWITGDNGATWAKTVITAGSAGQNDRPCVPRGYKGGDITLIWLYVRSYTNWFGPFDADIKMYTFADHPAPPVTSASNARQRTAGSGIFFVNREGFSLAISDPAASTLMLYSSAGRLVRDMSAQVRALGKGQHTVRQADISLPQGAYIAKFSSGNQSCTRPVIIYK